ncbi:AAA family ATPase [Microbacterium sp. A82]|uniref:MinD/ParA family ATP-binding protein n=1 Tax=Microbacterium sp. A82 TaxID=3450452 RepID=UPI003F383D44
MTPKNTPDSPEDDSLGVLDEAASLDTTALGILGQTAQVNVALPRDEDDDLVDDSVVDGEIYSELVIDGETEPPAPSEETGRILLDGSGIIIELPATEPSSEPVADAVDEIVDPVVEPDTGDRTDAAAPVFADETVIAEVVAEPETPAPAAAASAAAAVDAAAGSSRPTPAAKSTPKAKAKVKTKAKKSTPTPAETTAPATPKSAEPRPAASAAPKPVASAAPVAPVAPVAQSVTPVEKPVEPKTESATSAWIAAAMKQDVTATTSTESVATASESTQTGSPLTTSAQTAPKQSENAPAETLPAETKSETVTTSQEDPKPTETALAQRPVAARPEVALTSKRLGDQIGQSNRESADLLTADRLLDPQRLTKPEPEGGWSRFLYTISGRKLNIGDGKKVRARKALSARIAAPLAGGARFVPVLSRKGGVGKTTITALLGMALADARDDRVIAVDANPDRGTLADRVVRTNGRSVRDLVRIHDEVKGYHDISAIVARDTTRLDVLASDSDPRVAEAFSDDDYRDVADVAAHYYSLVLTDTGTGIVHSVMGATLDLSDQLIIVSGLSVDEARLASETLTWLETNGYEDQARGAIIVLNQSTPGSPLVRLNELEAHFGTRARSVVRMPYDTQIAGGGTIVFSNLQPETRKAARELAASLIEALRTSAA